MGCMRPGLPGNWQCHDWAAGWEYVNPSTVAVMAARQLEILKPPARVGYTEDRGAERIFQISAHRRKAGSRP